MPASPAKLRPPGRRPDVVSRPRLRDALLENSDRKLSLIIAPAGYGKTTLLTEFAHDSPAPVAWLTLDGGDQDPRGFIESLISSVQEQHPGAGATTLAALAATAEVEQRAPELARLFAADASRRLPGVHMLALDDFHEVNESAPVTAFLDELLRVLPDNLRIILAGRTLPNLTVSRLAVEHNLFGISEGDLRFTPEEVAALVHTNYGTVLGDAQAEAIAQQAEGWIAGLLLSIQGLLDGAAGDRRAAVAGPEPLYTYLAAEAYDRQPPLLRDFLLATSTMQVLTDGSCTAVLGRGAWMSRLADVAEANLFVARLGGGEPAYRYHPLFREFLQGRLRGEQPEQFRALHLRAARHLAEREDWPNAIGHYEQAEEHAEFARLIARIAPRLEQEGRWYLLAQTIDRLPEPLRRQDGALLVSRARAAGLTGDLRGAELYARQALETAERARGGATRAWALEVLGNALRRLGRTSEAIETLEAAQAAAPEDDVLVAWVQRELAGCHGVQGDFVAAAREFIAAYDYFSRTGNTYEAARAAYGVGAALARMGRADEACRYYAEAVDRWREAGDKGNVAHLLNNIGYLRTLQGEHEEARRLFDEGLAAAREVGHRLAEAALRDSLGSLLLNRGDLLGAMEEFRAGMEIAQDAGDLWIANATMEGAGLCALMQGDVYAATEWFERGSALAERQGSDYRRAQLTVAHALVLLYIGQAGSAIAGLQNAEQSLQRLHAGRDLIRVRAWLAHAHARQGDTKRASACFQKAAREALSLNVPALLDLPARWDPDAFAALPAGRFAELRDSVLRRVALAHAPRRPTIVSVPSLPAFAVQSFGRGQATGPDGAVVEWARETARELFFYLLLNGTTKSQRAVADLWPNADPAQGKATLYSAVYAIRRAIHPEAIVAVERTYSLNPDLLGMHDVAEFDRLYAESRTETAPARRRALFERLVALHTGPLLDGLDADWLTPLRRTRELRYLDTLESLVSLYAAAGAWDACLEASLKGLELDPDTKAFYAHASRAYRALGKPWSAARITRRARDRAVSR